MAIFKQDKPGVSDISDARTLNYIFRLVENLEFVLQSMGKENFTAEAWKLLTDKQPLDATPIKGSDNPVSSNGVYRGLSGKQDKSDNLTEIGQYGLTKAGKRFGVIPYVQSDGVMEVGSHIDFHSPSSDGSDFVQRIESDANGIRLGDGVVGKVTRTAGIMGHNATIYGQCFCTCLGNGNLRFDLSGKWYVASSVTNVDYGISKEFLRRAAYNNIIGGSGLANLTYAYDGECLAFSASDYTLGHPNVDYGWCLQEQANTYILARMYNTDGANGGWEGHNVNYVFPGGFYFKATIFAKMGG